MLKGKYEMSSQYYINTWGKEKTINNLSHFIQLCGSSDYTTTTSFTAIGRDTDISRAASHFITKCISSQFPLLYLHIN